MILNAAWDKVNQICTSLRRVSNVLFCDMSDIKASFIKIAKQEVESVDRIVESNSKARDLLLDVVYENSGISKSFFRARTVSCGSS